MNLESQVCTLEQARKLKELGVDEDNYFYWLFEDVILSDIERSKVVTCQNLMVINNLMSSIKAYTSSELGEMISAICDLGWEQSIITAFKDKKYNKIHFKYPSKEEGCGIYDNGFDMYYFSKIMLEAHARAEFLIYLLDNRDNVDIRQR